MKIRLLAIVLLSLVIIVSSSSSKPIYSIHYTTSYRSDKISKSFGCGNPIAYGYYQYPQGPLDALRLVINQNQVNLGRCQHPQTYAILFGSSQDYKALLNDNPSQIALRIKNAFHNTFKNMIIKWDILEKGNIQTSKIWLQKFISQLHQFKVFLKAPASYFCYTQKNIKYLIDVKGVQNMIIEMHGQQSNSYTSYNDIFQSDKKISSNNNRQNYPDQSCPKYPSYPMIKEKSNFYIQTTLQSQQAGYFGTDFPEFIKKAQSIYNKPYFYDSYPSIVIPF